MTQTAEEAASALSGLTSSEKALLHHIGFTTTVEDIDTMVDWYRKVLDLDVNYRGAFGPVEVCFLTNDDANHRVVFMGQPGVTRDPDAASHARLQHSAYEFPTLEGLLAKYARLKEQDILPYLSVDHGMTFSIYYMDPNGYGIELQTDSFGDWRSSKHWMATSEEFIQNPFGIVFNPETLAGDIINGSSREEIHRRAYYEGQYPPTFEQRKRLEAVFGEARPGIWDHPSWALDHPTFGS